jgi:hypothetical protein
LEVASYVSLSLVWLADAPIVIPKTYRTEEVFESAQHKRFRQSFHSAVTYLLKAARNPVSTELRVGVGLKR